jgi:hypothetical protein
MLLLGGLIGYQIGSARTTESKPIVDETDTPASALIATSSTEVEGVGGGIDSSRLIYTFREHEVAGASWNWRDDWLIKAEKEFIFQDKPGRVLHLCSPEGTLAFYHRILGFTYKITQSSTTYSTDLMSSYNLGSVTDLAPGSQTTSNQGVCIGDNIILLTWGELELVVDRRDVDDPSWSGSDTPTKQISLSEISFTQIEPNGSVTSSYSPSSTLVISTHNYPCLYGFGTDGVCFGYRNISYMVDLPSGIVRRPQKPIRGFPSADSVFFNVDATKALYIEPCPEGCWDDILVYYDLTTGEERVLLAESDHREGSDLRKELHSQKPYWIDSTTAIILGKEYKF